MVELSSRRITGFACNQGFAFYLFYLGADVGLSWGGRTLVERADLVCMLLFMVAGFGLLWRLRPVRREALLVRPLLFVYASLMALSALAGMMAEPAPWLLVARGALLGVPNALLLTAWGRSFSRVHTSTAVPEVMAGSLLGAVIALAFSAVGSSPAEFAVLVLPVISAAYISVTAKGQRAPVGDRPDRSALLSAKIIAGTACYGMAAGLMDTYNNAPGVTSAVANPVLSLVLFAAFSIGALSLLLSDGFGKGAALNKSYRLAVFVMMLGYLLVPLTHTITGEAVVLAGYLGLEAVLIALFLVIAFIVGADTAESFSSGFTALFAGEFVGVLVASGIRLAGMSPYAPVVVAGALVLFAYFFLFTERDFLELSEIADEGDAYELACERIIDQFKLSPREAEILPLALRGRTAERIAGELFVTKSTIDTHLRRIYAKCGVHSRQELIDLIDR